MRQLHCRAADSRAPSSSDSQDHAVTSGWLLVSVLFPLFFFIRASICPFYLTALLGSFICIYGNLHTACEMCSYVTSVHEKQCGIFSCK